MRTLRARHRAVSEMLETLEGTTAWQSAGALFVRVLGDFAQTTCTSTTTLDELPPPNAFVGTIALSRAGLGLELALVIDPASMRRLSLKVLGSEARDDAESLVLETVNILMGSLRRSLATDGFAFVLGLPASVSLADAQRRFDASAIRARVPVASAAANLELWLGAAPINNCKPRPFLEG